MNSGKRGTFYRISQSKNGSDDGRRVVQLREDLYGPLHIYHEVDE